MEKSGGNFGTSEGDNGVNAWTGSANAVGVFGRCDDIKRPGGGADGSGVFGLTVSQTGAGVFGANNGSEGIGVQGNGPPSGNSIGVSGYSESNEGMGVQGFGTWGVGGFASSVAGAGVVGGNHDGGAWGFLGEPRSLVRGFRHSEAQARARGGQARCGLR
jgi:hypothetical protein